METTTTLTTTTITLDEKIESLFSLKKITAKDIEHLDSSELKYLSNAATEILKELEDKERDDFLVKIEPVIDLNTKNSIWESNHSTITDAVTRFIQKHGSMPNKTNIASMTGLSRYTVIKHLKEYKQHPLFTEAAEQFKFMSHRILSGVFKFATNGDMRAARLYFEMIGALNKQQAGTIVNAQNNYIQINNTILSQENLKHLSTEQLNQIEEIVTNRA